MASYLADVFNHGLAIMQHLAVKGARLFIKHQVYWQGLLLFHAQCWWWEPLVGRLLIRLTPTPKVVTLARWPGQVAGSNPCSCSWQMNSASSPSLLMWAKLPWVGVTPGRRTHVTWSCVYLGCENVQSDQILIQSLAFLWDRFSGARMESWCALPQRTPCSSWSTALRPWSRPRTTRRRSPRMALRTPLK